MQGKRNLGLDFLRASAVLLVLVAHTAYLFWPIHHDYDVWELGGYLGVELFFVLSGFLIGNILVESAATGRFSLGDFWRRRWMRTLPNYYLFLVLNMAISRWADHRWPDAASYFVFAQNLAWSPSMFFIESWSLPVEEIFYLCAPVLMVFYRGTFLRRFNAVACIIVAIMGLTLLRVWYVATMNPSWDVGVRMVAGARLDAIAYGILAMLFWRHRMRLTAAIPSWLFGAGLAGFVAVIYLYFTIPRDTSFFARTLFFSLTSMSFAALLPATATQLRSIASVWIERSIRALARWSYSLYLCQLAVLRVMFHFGAGKATTVQEGILQSIVFMAISIAVAAFVYRFFEYPILRFRDVRGVPRAEQTLVDPAKELTATDR